MPAFRYRDETPSEKLVPLLQGLLIVIFLEIGDTPFHLSEIGDLDIYVL